MNWFYWVLCNIRRYHLVNTLDQKGNGNYLVRCTQCSELMKDVCKFLNDGNDYQLWKGYRLRNWSQ